MKKINFDNIKLKSEDYPEITNLVIDNYGLNMGCILHPHWKKDSRSDYANLTAGGGDFQSLSWMGNGYPHRTDYVQPYEDKYHFADMFENLDTIDVQSGMYQFYKIEELYNKFSRFPQRNEEFNVLEVGGGYGRLALFFLTYFGSNCHYVSVDFVPTSLLYAPQVIKQAFPDLNVGRYDSTGNLYEYNFLSLPTWRVPELAVESYDLGANIHSFQEMERRSVDYYKFILWDRLKCSGMLYVINNPPEKDGWYTNHDYYNLRSLFDEFHASKYPIGADWEKICGVPTLQRAFGKGDPDVIDTQCTVCFHLYAMTEGDILSICPKCGNVDHYA